MLPDTAAVALRLHEALGHSQYVVLNQVMTPTASEAIDDGTDSEVQVKDLTPYTPNFFNVVVLCAFVPSEASTTIMIRTKLSCALGILVCSGHGACVIRRCVCNNKHEGDHCQIQKR